MWSCSGPGCALVLLQSGVSAAQLTCASGTHLWPVPQVSPFGFPDDDPEDDGREREETEGVQRGLHEAEQ